MYFSQKHDRLHITKPPRGYICNVHVRLLNISKLHTVFENMGDVVINWLLYDSMATSAYLRSCCCGWSDAVKVD